MKMIKNILMVVCLFSLCACESWLDVDPMSQIKADELFRNEEGFHKALVGIYINMTKSSLYGGDMTLSTLDVMAQNYNTPLVEQGHMYERIAKYEYDNVKVKDRLERIWKELYNEIANCNGILERIDFQKDLFSDHYYELVRSEALALRAMFHLDLLRLYTPAVSEGLDREAIPYKREFDSAPARFSTTREVLAHILHDLSVARDTLRHHDPVLVPELYEDELPSYFQKRTSRMNYYAVTALMARVYLYMGNDALAYKYAKEVYLSEKFSLVTAKEAANAEEERESLTFRKEHILGLHVNGLQGNVTSNLFFANPLSSCLAVDEDEMKKLYGKNTTDIRYRYWFAVGSGGYMSLEKYRYGEYIPLLKYGEILLILAETSVSIDEAAGYLNELKTLRQIPAEQVDDFNLMDKLEEEYRKEFIGEGQLFYFYKRISKSQLPGLITIKKETYTLPIPTDELEFKPTK